MAQLVVCGPFREPHLDDQLRLDPMWPLVRPWAVGKRAVLRFERFQQVHHALQLALVEAGPRVPDVYQTRGASHLVADGLVNAEQQRAEVRARLTRLGPSAD